MNSRSNVQTSDLINATGFQTWRATLAADWKVIITGAIASFFLASIFMSGGLEGLIPDLSRPYGYSGDGLFHAWMAQRVTEGWLFDNARSGYPFGSNFLDFPGSDGGDHLMIKIFALIGGGWPAGVKLFFLFGFSTCFIATYVVGRAFGLRRSFAVTASVLYAFAPFHFSRLQHLFYTWYFVAPLFLYLALDIFLTHAPSKPSGIKVLCRKIPMMAIGMLILASFGVYYALFGIIILGSAGILSAVKWHNFCGMKKALMLIIATTLGVFINLAPNLIGTYKLGPNLEVAQRSPAESEIYGLKMMQLLMPAQNHRIAPLANVAQLYNRHTPLVNENATSSLGVIGAAGFMLALCYVIFASFQDAANIKLRLLAVTMLVTFLFSTIGGLGSLFAMLVSPSIRGWNRNSIFIACGAILFFFVLLNRLLDTSPRIKRYSWLIAALLLALGLYDQTPKACKDCTAIVNATFDSDRKFVQSIESVLPQGGAVYQLPYIGFPEVPVLHNLMNYQMMAGVLHSQDLHWSFGGMKGRPGDLLYRALAKEPMERQLEVIHELGFNGIYVDRRGYSDKGEAIISELSGLLHRPPLLQSDDNNLVFFKLDNAKHPEFDHLSVEQIGEKIGYFADTLGPRYAGDLVSGIDFTRDRFPDFIRDATGLSISEPWGRWSSGSEVVLKFRSSLPQKFTLIITAKAYANNAQKPTDVNIGKNTYRIQPTAEMSDMQFEVDLDGASIDQLSIVPPEPVSPRQLTGANDDRMLGIGFEKVRIVE